MRAMRTAGIFIFRFIVLHAERHFKRRRIALINSCFQREKLFRSDRPHSEYLFIGLDGVAATEPVAR